MKTFIIVYLSFGIIMGEGLIYHRKKNNEKIFVSDYLIAVFLIIFYLPFMMFRK